MPSLGLGLGFARGSSFNPSTLFTVGSRGFFYDFSDYSTQFTDTAGTTAITGVGQSLARVNDKSGLGNNATQATAGSRALTQVRPMGVTPRNLLTFSEAFDNVSGWTTAGTTLTANTSTSPEATTTADTLTASAATSVHRVVSAATTVASSLACVHSVYLKAGTHSFAQIHDGASTSYFANFNLTTGVVGTATGCTATMTSVGSGWYRCSIAMTLNAANPILCIGLVTSNTAVRNESWAAAGTETILLWGAQLEVGSTASTYQPTGPALINGEKRNLLTFTEQFDNAGWIKTDSSVIANSAAAPDGTNTADLLAENTATTIHGVSQATGTVWPDNTPYTATIYAKAAGRSIFWIESRSKTPTFPQVYFDLASGQVTSAVSGATGSIQAVGNGWYRCTLTANSLTGAAFPNLVCGPAITTGTRSYTGDGTSGVLIWGAQLELGPTPTAYQRVVTANEWYEPGFTSYRGIQFDGVDDFLQTAAIDFAGAESLGAELAPSATINGVAAGGPAFTTYASATVVAGVRYKLSYTVSGYSGTGTIGITSTDTTINVPSVDATLSGDGSRTFFFTAASSGQVLFFTRSTNTGNFSGITIRQVLIPADKMTVVAGVRKLSDAAQGMLVELTASLGSNNGAFALSAPVSSINNYRMQSKGTVAALAETGSQYPAPITNVVTGLGDISGDLTTLRVNGTQIAQSTADQGTGNFANDIVCIGRRGGTTLPFNGVLTFLCVINRTLTAGELAALEAYANSRTGAY